MAAASIATPKASGHAPSFSFPSSCHPFIVRVEEQLCRLRASSSPSTICYKLDGLKNLYECVECLLQLPLTQQALSHEPHDTWVEDILDGSLRMLDFCGTTRDVFSQMKDCVQDLESSLRRRNGGESVLADEIGRYIISRKKVNKMIHKCFGNLKSMQKKCNSALLDKNRDVMAAVSMLREVEAVSLTVFESLLSFVCFPKARSKPPSGWSLVSKLMQSKRVSCEGEDEEDVNEVEKIDVALNTLNRQKLSKGINVVQVQNVQKHLEALESSMRELEEGLECAIRGLIKTRVSLLNILNY